ncbi:hypothetical protein OK016_11030 [Vibrio chagasii]|nr:hypothetical protein [Vibrio chagasii]
MSRCAAIIENNSNTKLGRKFYVFRRINLLVELANGVQDKARRQEVMTQLTDIHNAILDHG